MLRFLTAGESHGPQLTVILDGVPAGLELDAPRDLEPDLRRRQGGHGRGKRQQIESDVAEISAGVRGGVTLGSPISLTIRNRDWDNWSGPMQVEAEGFTRKAVTRVRPGHADLAGMLKYNLDDARDVLERASARETAARVAAGAVAKALLRVAGTTLSSHVVRIGEVVAADDAGASAAAVESSPVRCADPEASARMVEAIDVARAAGDTLGGTAMVTAHHVVAGLGSYAQWDRRLDGRIAQAMCSIPSVKGVELGAALQAASSMGSAVHDRPAWSSERGFYHLNNRQGGLAGGVSNGEDVWARVHFKPISTLLTPLRSVDVRTGEEVNAHYERSDICVVPAGAVVAEAMLALVLAEAMLEKFGGDSVDELLRNLDGYRATLGRLR
ncbi:MAG: chorismate synthase [Candidatus Dormibacteraeota bacterium]|uniref:Chorismate synthase n=1 Tax=Candidatus Aeolococcus gillhamiae TaxID=3127015 RepID=A0A2W6A7E2_9BACT|nr:chorismate synthase [Candidatus Dormibacteraeota bacterium]PZR81238.1 MAG: chorismate synthase [Candidatus Dormibacter sp. RRmetagenome_bin12]